MTDAFSYDADFNNFYEDFIGKNKKSKETPAMTPAPTGGNKNFWSQGMVVGASSPVKEEPPKKGGFFTGLGEFIKSDTGQAVLSGVSKGIENQQGINSGNEGGGFEGANQPRPDGLSTGAIIGISIGGLAVLGLAIYLITKK